MQENISSDILYKAVRIRANTARNTVVTRGREFSEGNRERERERVCVCVFVRK